jgi:two-component system response regulator NreC
MVALQRIVRDYQHTRVLVLTMHDDPAYLRSALAGGASGYVLKRSVDAELLAAIRAVHRGGMFVDPSLARVVLRDVPPSSGQRAGSLKLLSERELQVLGLVARGYSSRQIATQILVSVKSVETYRLRFSEKLGLRNRSDVVRFAIQMGLLTLEALEADKGLPRR